MEKFHNTVVSHPMYLLYHINSRLSAHSSLGQNRKFPIVPRQKKYMQTLGAVPLLLDKSRPSMSVVEALACRRSCREFSDDRPLLFEQLSGVLHYSYGITHRLGPMELRAAPSAGARYPIEIYLWARNVAGLRRGIYHYDVYSSALDYIIADEADANRYVSSFAGEFNQTIAHNAHCVLFFSAIFGRTTEKYGEIGYRFVLLDAGHVAENIYLMATAYGLGCVGLGGFYEDDINCALELDGVSESVIYAMALGLPKDP